MNRARLMLGRWLGLAAVLVVVPALLGADKPKKTIDARGLKFQAPESWKTVPTSSQMRAAQLRVQPVEGDDFDAELVVYVFPGGAGGIEANIERWSNQFKDSDGKAPKAESKKVEGKNIEVTRVEVAGHYHPASFPGLPREPDRADARLLGAIAVTDKVGYYLKMVGPDKTMKELAADFDALIASLEVSDQAK